MAGEEELLVMTVAMMCVNMKIARWLQEWSMEVKGTQDSARAEVQLCESWHKKGERGPEERGPVGKRLDSGDGWNVNGSER